MSKQCAAGRVVLAAAAGLVLVLPGPAGAGANQGQDGDAGGVRCAVEWAPMRDGVRLATEVYLPAGDGPFPVILQRTPYNRRSPNPGSDCDSGTGRYFAERGYATLNQDTRGRYRSEGEFDAMRQEAADGYDAVEWAAAQPWSNGKVGMIGGSYVGLTQWQAAVEQPPHLVAIAPHYSSSDYHKGWTYQGGAFDLWFAMSWTAQTLAPDTLQRRLEAGGHAEGAGPRGGRRVRRRGAGEAARRLALAAAPRRLRGVPAQRQHRRLLRRVARAAELRRLLGPPRRRDEVAARRGAGPHHRRLVRHLPGRHHPQLHGGARGGRDRRGAERHEAHHARPLPRLPRRHHRRRHRLRPRQRARPERGVGALVRLLAEGRRQRRRRRPRGAALRDDPARRGHRRRRLLDHRRRVPAARRGGDALLPAERRRGQHGRRRRRPLGRGSRRAGRRVRLRPPRPGAHRRRQHVLPERPPRLGAPSTSARSSNATTSSSTPASRWPRT